MILCQIDTSVLLVVPSILNRLKGGKNIILVLTTHLTPGVWRGWSPYIHSRPPPSICSLWRSPYTSLQRLSRDCTRWSWIFFFLWQFGSFECKEKRFVGFACCLFFFIFLILFGFWKLLVIIYKASKISYVAFFFFFSINLIF